MNFDRNLSSGYMTNWAARLFARAIDRRLKPLGLSSAYMPVFFALAHGRELSQRALVEAASVEQPTMAATLKRMERDGLLDRRPDPQDRRSTFYRLSPKGMAMSDAVRTAGHAVNEAALAGLGEAERNSCLELLARIVSNLEDEEPDSAAPRRQRPESP